MCISTMNWPSRYPIAAKSTSPKRLQDNCGCHASMSGLLPQFLLRRTFGHGGFGVDTLCLRFHVTLQTKDYDLGRFNQV